MRYIFDEIKAIIFIMIDMARVIIVPILTTSFGGFIVSNVASMISNDYKKKEASIAGMFFGAGLGLAIGLYNSYKFACSFFTENDKIKKTELRIVQDSIYDVRDEIKRIIENRNNIVDRRLDDLKGILEETKQDYGFRQRSTQSNNCPSYIS